ncbi:MAG: hypothetical protein Tsb002_19400 [Wenzhouxiangellaceae bacterium]
MRKSGSFNTASDPSSLRHMARYQSKRGQQLPTESARYGQPGLQALFRFAAPAKRFVSADVIANYWRL